MREAFRLACRSWLVPRFTRQLRGVKGQRHHICMYWEVSSPHLPELMFVAAVEEDLAIWKNNAYAVELSSLPFGPLDQVIDHAVRISPSVPCCPTLPALRDRGPLPIGVSASRLEIATLGFVHG